MIINAILPVFIVVLAGYFLKQKFITDESFWKQVDRLIFFVLLPLMIIRVLINAPFDTASLMAGGIVFTAISCVAALSFIPFFLKRFKGSSFTSVFQGAVRINLFIPLSIGAILYPDAGVALISFLILFLISSGVSYSIIVLQYCNKKEGSGRQNILKMLSKNPIVLAGIAGCVLGAFIEELPLYINETLGIFGRATLPLALLGIGASLDFKSIKGKIGAVCVSSLLRLVICPLIGLGLAMWLELSQVQAVCCVLILAAPSAATSISFAQQMGGDVKLMSVILAVQTVISTVTLSAFVYLVPVLIP